MNGPNPEIDCCMQFGPSDSCEGTLILKLQCVGPLILEDVLAKKFFTQGSPRITFKMNNIPRLETFRQRLFNKLPGFVFYAQVKLDRRYPRTLQGRESVPSSFWEGYMVSDIVELEPERLELLIETFAKKNGLEYTSEEHMSLLERLNQRSQESRETMLSTNTDWNKAYIPDSTDDEANNKDIYKQLKTEQQARVMLESKVTSLTDEVTELRNEVADLKRILDQRFESVREAWKLAGN